MTCKSPRKERPRSPCRQPFPPLLWRLVTPSSALGTAGLSGDKLQVPHAPQVQSPSVGPLPTSLGSTSTHAWPILPAASDTVPVTMKSLRFVLIFDRALAHSLETCRGDGHRPGSKQLLPDLPPLSPVTPIRLHIDTVCPRDQHHLGPAPTPSSEATAQVQSSLGRQLGAFQTGEGGPSGSRGLGTRLTQEQKTPANTLLRGRLGTSRKLPAPPLP